MTISVFNNLGGRKEGDSAYTYKGVTYGFQPQTFTGDEATKQAKFQFDLERPTHCLLKNSVANVKDRKTNCSVFPISLGEDITSVCVLCCVLLIHKSTHFAAAAITVKI